MLDWRWVVSSHIDAYTPKGVTGQAWDCVAMEVRRIVKAAAPATPYSATQLLGPAARLAVFADGLGHRIQDGLWLAPELIEHFIDIGCPTAQESTRGNYRSRLLRLSEATLGTALATGRAASLSGSLASQPYARAEQTDLWSWSGGQPTTALRHGAKTLMATGFGCGLHSEEIAEVRSHDVHRSAVDGSVRVNVRGRRARQVVCRRAWEQVLIDLASALEPGAFLFRPDAPARGKNLVTNFLARTKPNATAPNLSVARARVTWIVELVDANVPLTTLVAAAGVDSLHAFSRLMPYFSTATADAAAKALRGPE